ncbi:hypothetical protein BH20ACT22_BH20ACT22_12220 [soil metagenome]
MTAGTLGWMVKEAGSVALQNLLDVQAHDSAIDRLDHRKATLPESQRLTELNDDVAELNADIAIATKNRDELAREQDRLEGEMGLADQKIQREESRLFSGAVSNPRELKALQSEVAMLKRNRGAAEDGLLEIMVAKDTADSTLSSLEAERDEKLAGAEELGRTVASLLGAIDSELEGNQGARAQAAATIPADLLELYEKLRLTKGGVGAAALEGGTCQGCHTRLPSREVERMVNEGGLQRCENCRRILVVV